MFVFSEELVRIRKENNILQDTLAKRLGFSRSYICKLESGERLPTRELIIKLADVCNIDAYHLNKLLTLTGFTPELDSSNESYRLLLKLSLELKEHGFMEPARQLIEKSIGIFDNTIEIYALRAGLNLLKKDFEAAIKNYEDAIKYYPETKISFYKLAITKAELIHNLGYVYFEKSLIYKREFELKKIEQLIKKSPEANSLDIKSVLRKVNSKKSAKVSLENLDIIELDNTLQGVINQLRNKALENLDLAIEKFENALKLEPENEHITDQLARAYMNRAGLEFVNEVNKADSKADSGSNRTKFLKKSISLYERFIGFPVNDLQMNRRLEASIFMAMGYARLFDIKEATKIINVVISCKPKYSISYYAKACIFSINGKDKVEILQAAYDSLKFALDLNNGLKKELKYEIDLLNLRIHPLFESRFINLGKQNIEET